MITDREPEVVRQYFYPVVRCLPSSCSRVAWSLGK